MWNRKDLKENAKALLKANYWKAVLASLVVALCAGAGAASGGSNAADSAEMSTALAGLQEGEVLALLMVVLGVMAVAFVGSLILSIFVYGPFEVGAKKLLANCKNGNAQYKDIVSTFTTEYGNTVKVNVPQKPVYGIVELVVCNSGHCKGV